VDTPHAQRIPQLMWIPCMCGEFLCTCFVYIFIVDVQLFFSFQISLYYPKFQLLRVSLTTSEKYFLNHVYEVIREKHLPIKYLMNFQNLPLPTTERGDLGGQMWRLIRPWLPCARVCVPIHVSVCAEGSDCTPARVGPLYFISPGCLTPEPDRVSSVIL
jgi:hypothetical protein